ncbi:TetR/AcrR family transcriptional regulator (plasmid) [Nicoliella spurrieriana]|uniref:TetR/AcrR family transcriptional regulator n=1 Tax=Nicoliella spurrieriana TaxID=2925830 RepID=A0A976RRB4_9LACO|nr:TetR/AcrR family transcriptional regulator [Nicoliella spurrieriana]UQS86196.1 TetR/AcrR family transcriptional regulator [Nicoliella spurrieriana]
MNVKDARVVKTQKALTDAFLRLRTLKSFEKISVNDLCKESNIGRATFYRHFKNKDEFISFASKEWLDRYLKTAFDNLNYFNPYRLELLTKIALPFFQFIKDNNKTLDPKTGANLSNIFYNMFQEQIQKIIDSYCEMHGLIFNGNSELLSAEIAGSVVYASRWYRKHLDADINETVNSVVVPLDKVLNIYFPQ